MQLVLAMLAFAVVLGVWVRSVGSRVYIAIFVFALVMSIAYELLYYRLFF